MSPWLTFVVGVIVGLLIGWLIDLLYRRRDTTSNLDAVESRPAPPDWTAPPPAAPVAPDVKPTEEPASPELPEEPALPAPPPELPEEPEPPSESVAAAEPLAALDHSQAAGWPQVTEAVAEAPVAPAVVAHVADEVPATVDKLPASAVEALAPNKDESAATELKQAERRDKLIIIEGIGPVYEKKLNAAGISTFRQLVEAGEDHLREVIQPQNWQRVNFGEWIDQARLLAEGKDAELKALQARLYSRKKA